jgi:predicted nucleic acid-binding protein
MKSKTAIVDAVALEIQTKGMRGALKNILNKEELIAKASDFNLDEYMEHVERLHAYIEAYGPLKI